MNNAPYLSSPTWVARIQTLFCHLGEPGFPREFTLDPIGGGNDTEG